MPGKARDIILIIVAVGIIVAALVPTGQDDGDDPTIQGDGVPVADAGSSDSRPPDGEVEVIPGASDPILDEDHIFFPMVPGSIWVYRVSADKELTEEDTWTLKVVSAPTTDTPGEVEAGFGDKLEKYSTWLDNGGLRTDALPFVEPLQFKGDRPDAVEGSLLPAMAYLIEGAVWKHKYVRTVQYESKDRTNKTHIEKAAGLQSDRAMVTKSERIIVPAGTFEAFRTDWLGRIDLKAKTRKVLAELTSEPFRKETAWFSKGRGMIRRRVIYSGSISGEVSFDLVMYRRPVLERYD